MKTQIVNGSAFDVILSPKVPKLGKEEKIPKCLSEDSTITTILVEAGKTEALNFASLSPDDQDWIKNHCMVADKYMSIDCSIGCSPSGNFQELASSKNNPKISRESRDLFAKVDLKIDMTSPSNDITQQIYSTYNELKELGLTYQKLEEAAKPKATP